MKKPLFYLIASIMMLVSGSSDAASGVNYEVEVGKTLRLDISDTGVSLMSNYISYKWEFTPAYAGDNTNFDDYMSFDIRTKNYAIVKGKKASGLLTINYTGYYYSNGSRKEYNEVFYVRVVESGTPATGPATLEITPSEQTIKVGETISVYAKQTRAIGGTYFYSEDTSIVSVTSGELESTYSYTTVAKITGKRAGTVNIVAKNVNGLTATCKITVSPVSVTSISILSNLTLDVGETYTLRPSITPSNAETTYTWTSDNGNIASVSQTGMVTARNAGTAKVTVTTDNGRTATCKVTVNAPQVPDEPEEPEEPEIADDNCVQLEDLTAYTGRSVSLPICMTNKDNITAIQMDLMLPMGISLDTDDDGVVKIEPTNRISSQHMFGCNRLEDGGYRIICYSARNTTISGNEGVIFNVKLYVADDVSDGDYEIVATNIELSDYTGTAHTGQDSKATITVKSYLLGDTDNNGKHTINDVVCIVNHILNQPNVTFIEKAADLDENGKITINDAVLLISRYILGTTSDANHATRRAATIDSDKNYLSIDDFQMMSGEVKTIEVKMTNNCNTVKGLQCDIALPQGLTFLYDVDSGDYVSASSRIKNKMSIFSEMQNENTLRVAGFCMGTSNVEGDSGTIFTLNVKADDDMQVGEYEIALTNVELSNGEAISVADRTSFVEIIDDTSGVSTFNSYDNTPSIIYDLKGGRIEKSEARNGLFIVDGKLIYIE